MMSAVQNNQELLVSIVIPVYNGADYLAEAIDSALAQTWPHIEIIVVDDGSDDGGRTAEVAARYGDRIRYERKANGGVATAVNTGIRAMRGRYLSWLSHDDIYTPQKVERQVKALIEFGRPAMAFSDFSTLEEASGQRIEVSTGDGYDPGCPVMALLNYRINGCATMVHRDCLSDGLWFDPGLPTTQDYELWFRIASRFPLIHVPGQAVTQRMHAKQGSRTSRFMEEVTLLWLSILDRLPTLPSIPTPDDLRKSSALGSLPILARAAEHAIRSRVRGTKLAVVLASDATLAGIEAMAEGLSRADVKATDIWAPRAPSSGLQALQLEWLDGRMTPLRFVPCGASDETWKLLRAAAESEAPYTWLAEESSRLPTTALLALQDAPSAVACLQDSKTGMSQEALSGAVFRTSALKQALADGHGTLGSLVYALVRLGEVICSPPFADGVAAQFSTSTATQATEADHVPVPIVVAPTRVPMPMHLSMALLRRPRWAGAVWRLLRTQGPARARTLLARWTGLEGYFDADWYLRAYPDIASNGIDPIFHYLLFGHREGRDPAPNFSTRSYIAQYPQVAAQQLNALQHYIAWGRNAGYQVKASDIGGEPPNCDDERATVLLAIDATSPDSLRFVRDLSAQMDSELRLLYLSAQGGTSIVTLSTEPLGRKGRGFDLKHQLPLLSQSMTWYGVRRVLVLDYLSFGGQLADILQTLNRPFDMMHISAGTRSAGAELNRRMSEPDLQRLHAQAQNIFAASHYLASQMAITEPSSRIVVASPPDPNRLRGYRPWSRPLLSEEPLRIVLIGVLDEASGRDAVIETLRLIKERKLPLQLGIFGHASPELPSEEDTQMRIWPDPGSEALITAVADFRPHLAWFPQNKPTACSYALTDAESIGLPVAATASGEFIERLQKRPLSWLLPAETQVEDWLEFFLKMLRDGIPDDRRVTDPCGQRMHDSDALRRHLRQVL